MAKWYERGLVGALGSTIGLNDPPQNDYKSDPNKLKLENSAQLNNMGQGMFDDAQGRQSAQAKAAQLGSMQNANTTREDQFRGQQMGLADVLTRRAQGMGGPSLAEQQMRAGNDANMKAALSMAAGARGGSSPLAQKGVAQNLAGMNQQTNQQAMQMRAQEQMQAENSLGALLAQGRGADQNTALANQQWQNQGTMQQGQFNQQTNLANLQAQMNQRQLNDARQQAAWENMFGVGQANQRGQMQSDQINAGIAGANAAANAAMQGGLLNTAGGLGGAAIMASDKRAKKNISFGDEDGKFAEHDSILTDKQEADAKAAEEKAAERKKAGKEMAGATLAGAGSGMIGAAAAHGGWNRFLTSDKDTKQGIKTVNDKVDSLLEALKPYEYEYKDQERFGEGRRLGVMAQNVEKADMGKELVSSLPDGTKALDVPKSLGAALAGIGRLEERLSVLESKKRK